MAAEQPADQQFVQMTDEEAIYQEEVALMEKRGRRLRRAALTAGIFQAVSVVCMIYSTIAIRWVLIEWMQPEKTVYSIAENMGMFKLGIITDTLKAVADTLVGVLLGMILIGAGVNPATSSIIVVFKIIAQAITGVSIVFHLCSAVMVDENLALYKTLQNYFYSENMPPIGTQIAYIMLLLNKYSGILAQGKKHSLVDLPSITIPTTSSHACISLLYFVQSSRVSTLVFLDSPLSCGVSSLAGWESPSALLDLL